MAGVKGDRWQWRGEEEEWSAEARTGPGRIRFAKHFRLCDQVLMLSLISFCDIWNYCCTHWTDVEMEPQKDPRTHNL